MQTRTQSCLLLLWTRFEPIKPKEVEKLAFTNCLPRIIRRGKCMITGKREKNLLRMPQTSETRPDNLKPNRNPTIPRKNTRPTVRCPIAWIRLAEELERRKTTKYILSSMLGTWLAHIHVIPVANIFVILVSSLVPGVVICQSEFYYCYNAACPSIYELLSILFLMLVCHDVRQTLAASSTIVAAGEVGR